MLRKDAVSAAQEPWEARTSSVARLRVLIYLMTPTFPVLRMSDWPAFLAVITKV